MAEEEAEAALRRVSAEGSQPVGGAGGGIEVEVGEEVAEVEVDGGGGVDGAPSSRKSSHPEAAAAEASLRFLSSSSTFLSSLSLSPSSRKKEKPPVGRAGRGGRG